MDLRKIMHTEEAQKSENKIRSERSDEGRCLQRESKLVKSLNFVIALLRGIQPKGRDPCLFWALDL